MPSTQYIGKAGQLAVMAELAARGYNVAIPEMDIGDDVFTVNDKTGSLLRIQVKTSVGNYQARSSSYRCQFNVKEAHVQNEAGESTHYVFVGRCGDRWKFCVLNKAVLKSKINDFSFGTINGDKRILPILFFKNKIIKTSTKPNAIDLTNYYAAWNAWPQL